LVALAMDMFHIPCILNNNGNLYIWKRDINILNDWTLRVAIPRSILLCHVSVRWWVSKLLAASFVFSRSD
jgi:hypothetical protein